MGIYALEKSEVLQVEGEFSYVGEDEDKIFVESSKALKAPFKKASLPQELEDELNARLEEAKAQKCAELNAKCDSFLNEFKSEALGEAYVYDSKLEDQLNLLGLVSANIDGYFRCRKENESVKNNVEHSKAQLKQVYNDGLRHKSAMIYKCGELKAKLMQAKNVEAVEAVVWE